MDCLCGKPMKLLGTFKDTQDKTTIELWACPPEGCGRIYLTGSGMEVTGTWYLAEANDRDRELI